MRDHIMVFQFQKAKKCDEIRKKVAMGALSVNPPELQ
jgi:hypothetical protein